MSTSFMMIQVSRIRTLQYLRSSCGAVLQDPANLLMYLAHAGICLMHAGLLLEFQFNLEPRQFGFQHLARMALDHFTALAQPVPSQSHPASCAIPAPQNSSSIILHHAAVLMSTLMRPASWP